MVRKLEEEYNRKGLDININKTKYRTTAQETIRNLETENVQEIKTTYKFKSRIEQDQSETVLYNYIHVYGTDT